MLVSGCALTTRHTVAGDQVQPGPLPRPKGRNRRRGDELVGRAARSVQAVQGGRRDRRSDRRVAGRTDPTNGAHVRVTGRVSDVATFGGSSVGLHIRETDLDFRR